VSGPIWPPEEIGAWTDEPAPGTNHSPWAGPPVYRPDAPEAEAPQPPAPPVVPGQPGPAGSAPLEPAPLEPAPVEPAPLGPEPGPGLMPPELVPPGPGLGQTAPPTAEEFSRRRTARHAPPAATMGVRGALRKGTLGLVKLAPGRREQQYQHLVDKVRRNFGGLRQVTVVNPKGGAGKTVAVLMLSMTFGQKRGGYVLAWDNNETQGTLGMRAQQDFHARTVRDLMRDLDHFRGAHGRVGDLSQYVRAQGEGMFDVLASDESATAGEMLTAAAFGDLREVVSRFYKLIFVDTGNNVRAENWQAAIEATDQLVLTMSARNDSAETAARMLDHLEQNGSHRLVRQAVTVVSMPPGRLDLDVPWITRHFAARTRTVLLAPYERVIDSGEPIRYDQLSSRTRLSWLQIAATVAEGL
jgi:MinD-like ATPase involved in chromosome partitioning or flagellar assembly